MREVAAGLLMLATMSCGRHPTDDDLIALFNRHEREFEQLRELAASGPGPRVLSPRCVQYELDRAETDTDREYWNAYLSLFDAIGLREGVIRTAEPRLELVIPLSSEGMAWAGSDKDIYYSDVEPGPLVPKLDDVSAVQLSCRCKAAYRMIDGYWYLRLKF